MCSQYEIKIKTQNLATLLAKPIALNCSEHDYSSHVYPFAPAPVIINPNQSRLELVLMGYSLIHHWSDSSKPKFATYNARLDRPHTENGSLQKIYEVPTWRTPFKAQRCLVPMTAFFESCHSGSHAGNIVQFSQKDQKLLFAAGIYDKWVNPVSKQIIHSYAIITDQPTEFILSVGHDRQPVFLAPENHSTWLNCKELPIDDAYNFLKLNQLAVEYQVADFRALKTVNTKQASLF